MDPKSNVVPVNTSEEEMEVKKGEVKDGQSLAFIPPPPLPPPYSI
jgi:hypothetical protein